MALTTSLKELFEVLYTKFFLRDILAKVVPGFIFLALLFPDVWENDFPFSLIVVGYGISFAMGMFMQTIGELLRIIKIHVWDEDVSSSMKVSLENLQRFLKRYEEYQPAATDKYKRAILMERERLVILKNMAATYAILALFVGAIFICRNNIGVAIGCFIVAFALRWVNHFHAREQKIWEEINLK